MKVKMSFKKVFGFIILLAVGMLMGYYIGKIIALGNTIKIDFSLWGGILFIVPITFFVIAWHEAGHALAGVSQGFDFKMYVVGPFMWEKQQEKWLFKWNKDVNKSGGLVICLPKTSENLVAKFSSFIIAGPLSSLLLTLICLLIFWLMPKQTQGFSLFDFCMIFTAFMSFMIFIVTIIPSQVGGFYTDGARFLRFRRGGDVAKFEVLFLSIIGSAMNGTRPKLLDINQLEEAKELAQKLNEPFEVYIHSFFHQVALDNDDIVQAEKHLLAYINQAPNIPDGVRNGVWLDAAYFYAFAKKDLVEANLYWAKFTPSAVIPKAHILATEASLSYLNNDNTKALSNLALAIEQLPNMMDKGLAVALHEKLLLLKTEIEKHL
jgi:hypothetical protein